MTAFRSRSSMFCGIVIAPAEIDEVFTLFSPQGERGWVPGWDPEMLHPSGDAWEERQVFRTREERGEAVWVISRLDRAGHRVEYHRVEPGRWVARVEVRCRPLDGGRTEASVEYAFIGLSESGNREIDGMTEEEYEAKMARWSGWIERHLAGRRATRS